MKARRIISLLTIALLSAALSGCGQSVEEKLVGKWRANSVLNDLAVQQMRQEAGEDKEKIQSAETIINAYRAATMDIEFKDDGSMISTSEIGQVPGVWQVVKQQDDRVTIVTEESEGEAQEIELSLESEDSFSVKLEGPVANLGVMRFTRIR